MIKSFNIPVVKRQRTKGTLILISISLTLFILLVISVVLDNNYKPPHYRTMVIVITMLVSVFVYIFRSYNVEEFKRIGNIMISFNTMEITLDEKTIIYSVADIKQLNIKLRETSEDSRISFNLGAFMNKEGIDNTIEIIDNLGSSSSYQVYIEKQSWIKLIDRILIEWPSEKIVN